MAETARDCLFRASQIADLGIFGDPNTLNQLAAFLRCDVTVLEAYPAEAKERNLEGAGPSALVHFRATEGSPAMTSIEQVTEVFLRIAIGLITTLALIFLGVVFL